MYLLIVISSAAIITKIIIVNNKNKTGVIDSLQIKGREILTEHRNDDDI